MANFVYNSHSGENHLAQWKRYLQQKEFSSDLTSAIHSQTRAYQTEIEKAYKALGSSIDDAARQQVQAIANAADIVVGKLDQGFSEVSEHLFEINSSINQLGMMLDWRLSQLIDQQRISNLLLGNIALLLRIPDVQKERQYYIEQGFKHYKNATLDDDLYQDALENLLEAEKREKTDYIVLHRIGMIYLYSAKMIDIQRAEYYLRKAAKYATVESDPNAQKVFNILAGNMGTNLAEQSSMQEAVKAIAAESYLQAGIACYAQGKLEDAVELSTRAFALMPSLLEAGFMKAKALAAGGAESEATEVLEGIIKAERFYALKTATDRDLAPKPKVQALLVKLRDEYSQKARYAIDQLNRAIETAQEVGAHNRLSESIRSLKTLEQEFRKGDLFTFSSIIPKASERYEQVFRITDKTIQDRIENVQNTLEALKARKMKRVENLEAPLRELEQKLARTNSNFKKVRLGIIGYILLLITSGIILAFLINSIVLEGLNYGGGIKALDWILGIIGVPFFLILPYLIVKTINKLRYKSQVVPRQQILEQVDELESRITRTKKKIEVRYLEEKEILEQELVILEQHLELIEKKLLP